MLPRSIGSTQIAWLVAAALTVLAQAEIWLLWAPDPDEPELALSLATRAAAAAATGALTLSIAVHRRFRALPLGLAIPAIAVAPAGPFDAFVGLALAVVVAGFLATSAARNATELWLAAGLALGVVAVTVALHPDSVREAGDLLVLMVGVAGPCVVGAALWLRHAREAELDRHARELDDAREADLASAAAAERARIARELHDVVAHAISVIVLQARGARRTLDGDRDEARAALDAIETTASRALGEMRRLVDVLRPADEPGALAPQPGLADLEQLLERVREAGLPVDLRVEGERVELPPGVDLAAYRVVQEALTNTLKHAGTAVARVFVRYRQREVEVEIVDDGTGALDPTGGRGTLGMRERTSLYGGTLEVGPRPDGGFGVLARLPHEPDGAA
jgi:signal transduction histidine kinase